MPVLLDDGRFKLLCMQFENVEHHLPHLGVKVALATPGPGVFSGFGSFIPDGVAQLVRFGIKKIIQGFFNTTSSQFSQVLLDFIFVNLNDIFELLRYIL